MTDGRGGDIVCRAAVLRRVGQPVEVCPVAVPAPRADDVRVRMVASGVCHSDLHVIDGDWPRPRPVVLGHEGAGIVESVGPHVSGVRPGDHVVLSWNANCRTCVQCSAGRPYLCERAAETIARCLYFDGQTRLRDADGAPLYSYLATGTFAEYAIVAESAAIPVRPDAPLERAALIGCAVATGVGAALNTAAVTAGSSVAVFGCGGVGLSIIQGARIAGCTPITAVDRIDVKLDLARELGATDTVLAADGVDVVSMVRGAAGSGVDYAFEAIGLVATQEQAVASLRPGGTAVIVGMPAAGEAMRLEPLLFAERGLALLGSNYGSTRPSIDFPRLVDWYMRGLLQLDPLVSQTYRLDRIDDAIAALRDGQSARGVIILGDDAP